jgi:hypothetical protein
MIAVWMLACLEPVEDRPGVDSGVGNGDRDARLVDELNAQREDYESWSQPAGWTDVPTESSTHVGLFVVRFDNPDLAAWDGEDEAPYGSIALKEEYDADGELLSFTAMYKVDGYDEAHNDWFWAKLEPDGTARAAGSVAMCWGCHQDAPQDYLHTEPPDGP